MNVKFDIPAKESLEQYYENYKYLPTGGTDLRQRADNYRKIVRTLSNIEHYLDHTYVEDGRKFIIIEDIGTIEYKITKKKEILVKNINFDDCQINSTLL